MIAAGLGTYAGEENGSEAAYRLVIRELPSYPE
jgi:hypothetical protein